MRWGILGVLAHAAGCSPAECSAPEVAVVEVSQAEPSKPHSREDFSYVWRPGSGRTYSGDDYAPPEYIEDVGRLVLSKARSYEGVRYRRNQDDPSRTSGFGCVAFVERVLLDLGIEIDDPMRRRIFGSAPNPFAWSQMTYRNTKMNGVSSVLADKGLADMVRIEDARPGDFYHVFRERGRKAHSAIVDENHMTDGVEPWRDYGPHLVIYGAHSNPGYVTSIRSRGFDDPDVKVFISRLRPEAIRKRR